MCCMTEQIYRGVIQDVQLQVLVQDRVTMLTETGTDQNIREFTLITHFIIWRERCNCIFKEKAKKNDIFIQEIKTQWRASALEDQERNQI